MKAHAIVMLSALIGIQAATDTIIPAFARFTSESKMLGIMIEGA
jgi:hypothetical protein